MTFHYARWQTGEPCQSQGNIYATHHVGKVSVVCPHGDPPLSPGGGRRPLLRSRARRRRTPSSASDLPSQECPSHQTHNLTCSNADDRPGETRYADERVERIDGLEDVHGGAIRQDDAEVEEKFRGYDERGKEVDGDGDEDQEWREERKDDDVEERDDMRNDG